MISGDCSYCKRPYYYSDYTPSEVSPYELYNPQNPYELTQFKCNHVFHSRIEYYDSNPHGGQQDIKTSLEFLTEIMHATDEPAGRP